jgi:hypothetical protein
VFGDLVIIGERAWDAMRGLDYLLSLRDSESQELKIDPNQIAIVRLSLGGWITAYTGALEPRFALTIPGCCSQDVMRNSQIGDGHCLRWLNADINEYIDTSDIYPLIAPRLMIIETGKKDNTYSTHHPPFSSDKQVARRSRVAYNEKPENFVHYLHYDKHKFHVGDINPHYKPAHDTPTDEKRGVRVPDIIAPPTTAPFSTDWQTNGNTFIDKPTLFHYVNFFLGIH